MCSTQNQKAKTKTAPSLQSFGEPRGRGGGGGRGEMSSCSPALERCRWSAGELSLHCTRQQGDSARPCGTGSASQARIHSPVVSAGPSRKLNVPPTPHQCVRWWWVVRSGTVGSPHSHFPPLSSPGQQHTVLG